MLAAHTTSDAQHQAMTNKVNANEIYTRLPATYTKDFLVGELNKNKKVIE